jgi:hypothetical protein
LFKPEGAHNGFLFLRTLLRVVVQCAAELIIAELGDLVVLLLLGRQGGQCSFHLFTLQAFVLVSCFLGYGFLFLLLPMGFGLCLVG